MPKSLKLIVILIAFTAALISCVEAPQNRNPVAAASDGTFADFVRISWDSVKQAESYTVWRQIPKMAHIQCSRTRR